MRAEDVNQLEAFDAATLFAKSEGIIPAPESSHAIAVAIRKALKAKEEGRKEVILFNLSGHGLIDMAAYDSYIAGDLTVGGVSDEDIARNLKSVEEFKI